MKIAKLAADILASRRSRQETWKRLVTKAAKSTKDWTPSLEELLQAFPEPAGTETDLEQLVLMCFQSDLETMLQVMETEGRIARDKELIEYSETVPNINKAIEEARLRLRDLEKSKARLNSVAYRYGANVGRLDQLQAKSWRLFPEQAEAFGNHPGHHAGLQETARKTLPTVDQLNPGEASFVS